MTPEITKVYTRTGGNFVLKRNYSYGQDFFSPKKYAFYYHHLLPH